VSRCASFRIVAMACKKGRRAHDSAEQGRAARHGQGFVLPTAPCQQEGAARPSSPSCRQQQVFNVFRPKAEPGQIMHIGKGSGQAVRGVQRGETSQGVHEEGVQHASSHARYRRASENMQGLFRASYAGEWCSKASRSPTERRRRQLGWGYFGGGKGTATPTRQHRGRGATQGPPKPPNSTPQQRKAGDTTRGEKENGARGREE